MSSIEERFTHHFGHDGMPAWLEAKLHELGPEKEKCLIMSIPNFKEIAEELFPAANSDCCSESFYLWHKNCALTFKKYSLDGDAAYRAIVGTHFPLFSVMYGPGMPAEWCAFSVNLRDRRDFVLLTGKEVLSERNTAPLHFGGGRTYHEPVDHLRSDMKCKAAFSSD